MPIRNPNQNQDPPVSLLAELRGRQIGCWNQQTTRTLAQTGKMWKDRGPGVKILWLWAIGTAGILVTSVVRTRLRDMEQLMNAQQQTPGLIDDGQTSNSEDFIREEKG